MLPRLFVSAIFLCHYYFLFCQHAFVDATASYFPDTFFRSTLTVGATDMNGDYLDDLITLHEGNKIVVGINQGYGRPFKIIGAVDSVAQQPEWSFAVGDLNNDGIAEILTSGAYNKLKVYTYQTSDETYAVDQNIATGAYGQGCNIIDFNNDGWNDFFLSNDHGESKLFVNDGQGSLSLLEGTVDYTTDPPSDMSGNYGSEWVDLDGDGVLEFFLAKCSAFAAGASDPRRINQLYIKSEDGIYRDVAKEVGLDDGAQSWTSVFADLDNDGDLDLAVANHYDPHVIMQNIEGVFVSVQHPVQENIFSFQVAAADFDNNGYIDLIFTGDNDLILYNQGDFKFAVDYQPFGVFDIHAPALGDFDQDGNIDVFASYGKPIIDPGYRGDKIWLGSSDNDNHYVSFYLLGKEANSRGIGTKVLLYGPWGIQQRNMRAGQGYSIVNSPTAHFGLGDSEVIDSVTVIWPGGKQQVFREIQANEHYLLEEDACLTLLDNQVNYQRFCPVDSVVLEVPQGLSDVKWNDGSNHNIKIVKEDGMYYYFATNHSGCTIRSEIINTDKVAYEQPPSLAIDGLPLLCQDELSFTFSGDSIHILTLDYLPVSTADYYHVLSQQISYGDDCGNIWLDTQEVVEVVFPPDLGVDSIITGDTLVLPFLGDSVHWYPFASSDEKLPDSIFSELAGLTYDTSFYAEIYIIPQVDTMAMTTPGVPEEGAYTLNTINREMYFDVLQPLVLQSITCYTDIAGFRTIEIFDDSSRLVFSKDFDLKEGSNICQLKVELQPGYNYFIKTNKEQNKASFGFSSPRLVRSNEQIFFPYSIPGYLDINGFPGVGGFYYFYDWVITPLAIPCVSPRLEKRIIVGIDNSTSNRPYQLLKIFPNPTMDVIKIDGDDLPDFISIINNSGKEISRQKLPDNKLLDLSGLPVGIYFLHGQNQINSFFAKVIKH